MPVDIVFEDYQLLCDTAREFNEYVPPDRVRCAAPSSSDAKGDRPGDEYNRRADWAEVLEPHGWRVDRTSGDVTYWTRPGKGRGTSATTGKCKTEGSGDLLYVFSSNADPFEPDAAYSKFAAHATLDHGGDFAAAARGLRDPATVFDVRFTHSPDAPDDGVVPDPDFATNEDLRKLDLGVLWVWERWLQFGTVNLLAAEGGLGKTRFMADLCRRVNSGLAWPDGTPTTQWPSPYLAMWVAGDRNHGELLDLSEAFGFGERICYSGSKKDPLGGVTLQTPSDYKTLYRRVKAAKPLFLIVDTAGGTTGLNLAKQEDARAFFAPLSDLSARLRVCTVVITHLNATKKVLGKRAEERVRCVVRMTAANKEAETQRRVEVIKSNSLFPKPLGMRLGGAGNEYDDNPPPSPEDAGFGFQGATPEPDGDGDSDRGPPTKTRECADWLSDVLSAAPQKVYDLRRDSEKRGFSTKTLYKAKAHLDLIEAESEGYKWWALKK